MEQKKIRIKLGSETLEGTLIPATSTSEHWNEYLLEDGTVIKMKLVATEIVRIDGRYDNDDNPLYVVKSSNVMAASSPDSLKKRKE